MSGRLASTDVRQSSIANLDNLVLMLHTESTHSCSRLTCFTHWKRGFTIKKVVKDLRQGNA